MQFTIPGEEMLIPEALRRWPWRARAARWRALVSGGAVRPAPAARGARNALALLLGGLLTLVTGCGDEPWNSPYPSADSDRAIHYDSFSERPKHLDPVSSYSENEALFNGQIYEPVVQYHFLKRPYQLVPLTAAALPEPAYYDAAGEPLPDDAPREQVAEAVYRITIKPGILYQPHPAFATREDGSYHYHALAADDLEGRATLADFPAQGTRELVAADYVYQIKRLVHPRLHSPIAGLMSK
ncbi:MAG: hypothetical protein RLW62_11260, partial [Gammaproteobacteria bacterium]